MLLLRLHAIEAEEKLLTAPYHLNQRKRLNRERAELEAKLRTVALPATTCRSAEFANERYKRATEYQTLLEKLEQKLGFGSGSETGTVESLKPGSSSGEEKGQKFCPNPECREQPLIYDSVQSVLTCQQCGKTITFIDATANLTAYGDEVEIVSFAYKRVGHFRDQLLYAQGKESTRIDEAIILQICLCLRRDFGFTSKLQIQPDDVTKAMKKLGLRKYYKNRIQVHTRITGIPPFRLTPAQEKGFLHMFKLMQPSYEVHQCKDRSSFLPYKLVAHRFCDYFDLPEFRKLFPLPKSRPKLRAFDLTLSQIAKDLGWDVKRFKLTCF